MTKKRTVGMFWLWQNSAYAKGVLTDGEPVEIFRTKIMPATPQGEYVITAVDPETGDAVLDEIAGMSLAEARESLAGRPGFFVDGVRR